MDYNEFLEWTAFYEIEPFGTPTEDNRWENLLSLFWSANSTSRSKPPRFFDRDPEETKRIAAERSSAMSLDEKLRAYFAPRAAEQEPESLNS
jgi:hypothetical protein